jgi:hypothetical protein
VAGCCSYLNVGTVGGPLECAILHVEPRILSSNKLGLLATTMLATPTTAAINIAHFFNSIVIS